MTETGFELVKAPIGRRAWLYIEPEQIRLDVPQILRRPLVINRSHVYRVVYDDPIPKPTIVSRFVFATPVHSLFLTPDLNAEPNVAFVLSGPTPFPFKRSWKFFNFDSKERRGSGPLYDCLLVAALDPQAVVTHCRAHRYDLATDLMEAVAATVGVDQRPGALEESLAEDRRLIRRYTLRFGLWFLLISSLAAVMALLDRTLTVVELLITAGVGLIALAVGAVITGRWIRSRPGEKPTPVDLAPQAIARRNARKALAWCLLWVALGVGFLGGLPQLGIPEFLVHALVWGAAAGFVFGFPLARVLGWAPDE